MRDSSNNCSTQTYSLLHRDQDLREIRPPQQLTKPQRIQTHMLLQMRLFRILEGFDACQLAASH